MKKFSNVTNQKIGTEPTPKNIRFGIEMDPLEELKLEVRAIMDSLLKVQIYGPINPILQGTLKVEGQELFIEALMDLLESKTKKDKVKLIESLKGDIQDWEALDRKIDEVKNQKVGSNKAQMFKHKEVIRNFYQRYKDDETLLMERLDKSIEKMKNGELAFHRAKAAEELSNELPKSVLRKISEKYLNKSNDLGFKYNNDRNGTY